MTAQLSHLANQSSAPSLGVAALFASPAWACVVVSVLSFLGVGAAWDPSSLATTLFASAQFGGGVLSLVTTPILLAYVLPSIPGTTMGRRLLLVLFGTTALLPLVLLVAWIMRSSF